VNDPEGLPCPNPECSSSDGFKIQDNGWGHCFVCGYNKPPKAVKKDNEIIVEGNEGLTFTVTAGPQTDDRSPFRSPPDVFKALPERGISKEAAEKYQIWKENGFYFFPNYEKGQQIGLKMRSEDKRFKWKGKQSELFGQHLFPPPPKVKDPKYPRQITVVEGEFDAPAAYELMGSRYPVVSLVNGCGTAERDVKRNYEYLNSFDTIVFCFDNDDAGREAAQKCGGLFAAGKVRILHLKKHNDPNDYLRAKDSAAFTKEWWGAPTLIMDGLKLGSNMWDEIINRPSHFTTTYPWNGLNHLTYGIRLSEMVVVTAETKIGKTSILKEIEYKLLMDPEIRENNYGVGFIHLEEPNYDTAIGLMSVHKSKPYHLPDTPKTEEELRDAYDAVINTDRVVIWDHFGSNSVDAVVNKVRHMAALGCKYIVLDHLSIVVSDQSGDERKQLDEIATKLKTLCMELNIALICVIHQNRAGQIRGTAGVEQLANIVIKLYRDKLDPDPWRRNITKVVVENNRFCGRTGPACYLWYNEMTGRLPELTDEEITRYEEGGTLRDDEVAFDFGG
jgi:twinkle protein